MRAHKNPLNYQLVFFLLVIVISENALTGGLEFPDLGAIGRGRGGAYTAKADSAEAYIYNPAGLSKAQNVDLLLSLELVHLSVDFTRTGAGACISDTGLCVYDPALDYSHTTNGEQFETVSMSKLGPLPVMIANWGNFAHVEGLALSLGMLPPSSFGMHEYPEDGAQRYSLVESSNLMVFPGIGLAYKINRYFQIGGIFTSGFAHINQSLMIRPAPSTAHTSYNENVSGDAKLEINAKDPFIPTGTIGIMSNPVDWFETGITVKLPAVVEASGDLTYTAPELDASESYMSKNSNDITLKQHFPMAIRFGARYIHRRFDVEADFVFENWASLNQFDVLPDAIVSEPIDEFSVDENAMPDTAIKKNFRNTYSVRVGGDVVIVPQHLNLRMGAFFQSSAYPEDNSTFNIDFPYATQIGIGGGLSWYINKFVDVSLAYQHIFQPDVEVTNGIVQQQGLPARDTNNEPVDIGNIVNNGLYEVSLNVISFAVGVHL